LPFPFSLIFDVTKSSRKLKPQDSSANALFAFEHPDSKLKARKRLLESHQSVYLGPGFDWRKHLERERAWLLRRFWCTFFGLAGIGIVLATIGGILTTYPNLVQKERDLQENKVVQSAVVAAYYVEAAGLVIFAFSVYFAFFPHGVSRTIVVNIKSWTKFITGLVEYESVEMLDGERSRLKYPLVATMFEPDCSRFLDQVTGDRLLGGEWLDDLTEAPDVIPVVCVLSNETKAGWWFGKKRRRTELVWLNLWRIDVSWWLAREVARSDWTIPPLKESSKTFIAE